MSHKVDQIYVTHCTYGSSAIERRTGEDADKVLGHSVRASSLDKRGVRTVYRALDGAGCQAYELYADTPGDQLTSLTALSEKAPRRLIVIPELSGRQVVGQVCHRQEDTSGRRRSYFGHLLITDREQLVKGTTEAVWSVFDCLNLWYWDGWQQQDNDQISWDLEPLTSLPVPTDPTQSIDDALILSFLRDDESTLNQCPNHGLLPERWQKMPKADRQKVALLTIQNVLNASDEKSDAVLLLVEPEMAIVLYYLAARLLPECIRNKCSFSSYEAARVRIQTTIAASWFYDPAHAKTPKTGHNVTILNTLKPETLEIAKDPASYAMAILKQLIKDGSWEKVDQLLAVFDDANPTNSTELKGLVKATRTATNLLSGKEPVNPEEWRNNKLIEPFVTTWVQDHFSGPVDANAILEVQRVHDRLYPILELLSAQDGPVKCREVLKEIAEVVGRDKISFEHLFTKKASAFRIDEGFKAQATLAFMTQHKVLPAGDIADLFGPFQEGTASSSRTPDQVPILCRAIQLAHERTPNDLSVLQDVWNTVSENDPRRGWFYTALLENYRSNPPAGQDLTESFLAQPEDLQAKQQGPRGQPRQEIIELVEMIPNQDNLLPVPGHAGPVSSPDAASRPSPRDKSKTAESHKAVIITLSLLLLGIPLLGGTAYFVNDYISTADTGEKTAEEKEKERIAKEKAEQERIAAAAAAGQTEQERIALAQAEEQRIAEEKAAQERIAASQTEEERKAAAEAEEQRMAAAKAEMERLYAAKAEMDRKAKEKAEKERMAAVEAEKVRMAAAANKISKAYKTARILNWNNSKDVSTKTRLFLTSEGKYLVFCANGVKAGNWPARPTEIRTYFLDRFTMEILNEPPFKQFHFQKLARLDFDSKTSLEARVGFLNEKQWLAGIARFRASQIQQMQDDRKFIVIQGKAFDGSSKILMPVPADRREEAGLPPIARPSRKPSR